MITDELKEYRCYLSKRLLCKAAGNGQIEIMNPENRILNYVWPSRKHQDIWPKGQEFLAKAVDLRCKECVRLQARAIGTDLVVEIKCKYCHTVSLHNLEEIEGLKTRTLSTAQKEKFMNEKTIAMNRFWENGVRKYINK